VDLDSYSSIVIAEGPLFYWRFGETSGATANDSSGNGRAGTITSLGAYNQPSLLAGATENTAFSFNGSSSRVEIADASWMDVSVASWEAWVQTTPTASNQPIIARNATAPNTAFSFVVTATSGYLQLALSFDGTSVIQFISTANVGD